MAKQVEVAQPAPQLRIRMEALVSAVRTQLKTVSQSRDNLHLAVCHNIAGMYSLYDSGNMFPVWLSLIVQYEGREMGLLQ